MDFDAALLNVRLNAAAIKQKAKQIQAIALACDDQGKISDLVLAVSCIDLTTLAGDDSACNVGRLCWRALNPLSAPIVEKLKEYAVARGTTEESPITTGAVCVYPTRAAECKQYIEALGSAELPIATVVAGFPAGQGRLSCTLEEINFAIGSGATEIDIVINRTLALNGHWKQLYDDIKSVADLCNVRKAHLKVILSTGELASLENIYKSASVAMWAGAHFVKTSTGKESLNAKLVYGLVMTRAIRDFYLKTGIRVGLKPAGGLKDGLDALYWVTLMRTQLGPEWLHSGLFRLGASSMLANIEAELYRLTHAGCSAAAGQLSF
ncbi:PREDICTED: deoxyribose-phosphate aldolase-like [Rhagoletis zephyria]|uniref:deoxyribose-phosphate aldolase-like n=1 Tax=Rhagoletis zephyria TaxID=28612 RepID=UPI0008119A29|nr:PREDICTED: deoxyribose-phosphate aldolase-like [Rhagoletis zephyria]